MNRPRVWQGLSVLERHRNKSEECLNNSFSSNSNHKSCRKICGSSSLYKQKCNPVELFEKWHTLELENRWTTQKIFFGKT